MVSWKIGGAGLLVFGLGVVLGQVTAIPTNRGILTVPVNNTRPMDLAPFKAALTEEQRGGIDLPGVLARIVPQALARIAREQAIVVTRIPRDAENYRVDVFQDGVPDDDSIAGRYTTLVVTRRNDGPGTLSSGAEAWRCWDGRGHSSFEASPCK